jgi:hypothetical protein
MLGIAAIATIGIGQHLSAQEAVQKPLLRGYYLHKPWTGGGREDAVLQALAGATIPMFPYGLTATKDGLAYNGMMVGTDPSAKPPIGVKIPAVIVPLRFTIGVNVFEPMAPNACDSNVSTVKRFVASPLIKTVPNLTLNGTNVGTVQYINGFRRAEFFTKTGGAASYQNPLSPMVVTDLKVGVNPGTHGSTFGGGCNLLGLVNMNWLDNYLTGTLIPFLQAAKVIAPTNVVFFLVKNVVETLDDPPTVNNCCVLGYHSATGSPVQVYSPMDYDTTSLFVSGGLDAAISSHEIGEASLAGTTMH